MCIPSPPSLLPGPQVSGTEMQDSTEWIRGSGRREPQIKKSLGRPGLSKGPDIRLQPLCSPHVSLAGSGLLSGEEKENLFTSCEEKAKAEMGGQREENLGNDYVSQPPSDKCFLSAD